MSETPADSPPEPGESRWLHHLLRRWWGLVLVYAIFVGAYAGASAGRLRGPSPYNHFVYLADCWLHGRLALKGEPPNENDWAKVEVLHLRDGRVLKGTFSRVGAADRFYPLSGPAESIPADRIASRSSIRYVSFPPLPAVLLAPFVAVWNLKTNDVLFTVFWAALNPLLLLLLLRDLRRRGLSRRNDVDDLWLVFMFGVGSVYYFASVLGQVWYTAHVVAVTCGIAYCWAAVDAYRPWLAGIFLGLGLATRPELGFMFPLFVWGAYCKTGLVHRLRDVFRLRALRAVFPDLLRFGVPAAAVLAVLMVHNYARFEHPLKFGHEFLNIEWQERIQRWGLFNYHFLSRNLAAALILLPRIMTHYPYVRISHHGMSLLLTSPNLAYVVAPAEKSRIATPLWFTIGTTALPSLLYQNSGYIQFGYRFSLDYMIFFVVLLAVGARRFSWLFKALVVVAFAINLFLAITFDRYMQFAYADGFFPHGTN